MQVQLSGLIKESIVDGTGVRMTIFFQGCPHHCPGCHNPQTWSEEGGYREITSDIKAQIVKNPLLTGITLSGGEPFLQRTALSDLAAFAHSQGLDVWCYTGFTWEQILKNGWKKFLADIDVLVDGRFDISKKSYDLKFRGSGNQRIIDVQESLKNRAIALFNA